ncbi:MAG: hypothetical protein QOJ73_7011, partial [Streptosporangiaceae bacterium]|nr:hypothetical protein [Streptosporangiaceae bacterium]
MMPWWVLAILIFGANFAIWGFVSLCRHIAALIRKVRAAGAIRRAARAASLAGPAEPDALARATAGSTGPRGSAMSQTRGPGAWGLSPLPAALAQPASPAM